ncbi:MAG TPA: hypothetical protein VNL77_13965 [Roseiflexaceae bacterium]|nr:hypothetical protein [Roseiflexaceae bacterium]
MSSANGIPIPTTPTITHPETAWVAQAVPVFLTIGTILLITLLLRGKRRAALGAMLLRRAASQQRDVVDPVLVWAVPITSETTLLGICLVTACTLVVVLTGLAPFFVALVLAGPLTAVIVWGALWAMERRYVAALDAALPAAVGRLQAQLRAGSGFQHALQKLLRDMPAGPLMAEWSFLQARLGAPLSGPHGALATPQVLAAALLAQTPSQRHAAFLAHLEVALGQPHDVLVQRVQAAYEALQHAEQRRSAANTELSQMRYSGIAISLAGLTMALYLFATQQERFQTAYQGALGAIVGCVVVAALLLPLVGGFFLSQADDLDY